MGSHSAKEPGRLSQGEGHLSLCSREIRAGSEVMDTSPDPDFQAADLNQTAVTDSPTADPNSAHDSDSSIADTSSASVPDCQTPDSTADPDSAAHSLQSQTLLQPSPTTEPDLAPQSHSVPIPDSDSLSSSTGLRQIQFLTQTWLQFLTQSRPRPRLCHRTRHPTSVCLRGSWTRCLIIPLVWS